MTPPEAVVDRKPERLPYLPPELRALGDIREMTLGGSGCELESGGGATTFDRTFMCP